MNKNLKKVTLRQGYAGNLLSQSLYIFQIYTLFISNRFISKWEIAKQLPGLNPLSLSNNRNYRLKKSGFFPLQ